MLKRIKLVLIMVVLIGGMFVAGCESGSSNATKGTVLGGAAGAGIGALAGGDTQSTLIGAALGGVLGHTIGAEKDREKTETQTQVAIQEANTFYVNITNSNGSVTPVRIVKQGNFYVGPRGEQYSKLPTEEELKPFYGF